MGSQITGSSAYIAAKKATTFGTAVAASAGDKMEVESLNHSLNAEELSAAPIGSGLDMQNDAQAGATSPSISIEKLEHYDDAGVFLEALFFGGASVSSMGSGAYIHSILYNSNRQQYWATVAFQATSTTTFEYPSCVPTRYTVTADTPPDYVRASIELLGNSQQINGETQANTVTTLRGTTLANSKRVIVKPADYFEINAQAGGALSGSDALAIKSITIEYMHEAQHVQEIKGAAGNGQVVSSGNPTFSATVTIETRNLQDQNYFLAQHNGTEYKALLYIQGDLIGGAQYYERHYYFPRLKLITDPTANLTSPGENPQTIVFKALAATTAPTGMISNLPYMRIQNTKSSAYL